MTIQKTGTQFTQLAIHGQLQRTRLGSQGIFLPRKFRISRCHIQLDQLDTSQ